MTEKYSAVVTGNFPINTDTLAIEIDAPASTTIKITKVRVTTDDGTGTTVDDMHRKIMLHTESVAGTGGSTYTPMNLDDNNSVSAVTVKIGPMTMGTLLMMIDLISVHSGSDFYWQAADENDKIVITPGGIFGIVVNPAG